MTKEFEWIKKKYGSRHFKEVVSDSNKRLRKYLVENIRPLVTKDDDILYYIKTTADPEKGSYLWAYKIDRPVKIHELDRGERIITFHTFGAPSLFKPSVYEVVSQIPIRFLFNLSGNIVAGFEILNNKDGLLNRKNVLNSYYHWVFTRLYYQSDCLPMDDPDGDEDLLRSIDWGYDNY